MTMDEQSDTSSQSQSSSCCSPQACCAYFMMAFSGLLLFAGMFLAFYLWNYLWLITSGIGVVLLFAGSCMYYCAEDAPKSRSQRKRIKHAPIPTYQRPENEDLLPSAPLHNAFSSASQLCLLPSAYFQGGYDDTSIVTLPNVQPNNQQQNYNQITLNGHNFLLVPLNSDGSVADTTSLVGRQVSQTGPSNQESSTISNQPTRPASAVIDLASSNIQPSTAAPENHIEDSQSQNEPRSLHTSERVQNSSTNCDLYVTILNENDGDSRRQIAQNQENLVSCSYDSSMVPSAQTTTDHSICLETSTNDANEQTSPSSQSYDSSLDLSSNASTVVDNLCANATVPKVILNSVESSESQNRTLIDLDSNIPSEEARSAGGATGVNTLHPDYVSASDDDSISCGRSSPPPSYAEVAREDGLISSA